VSEIPGGSTLNTSTTYRSELPRPGSRGSTSRTASPVIVVSEPVVVSNHPPLHVLRVLPRAADATSTLSQAVRPVSAVSVPRLLSSQPSWMSVAASPLASRFRPPSSTVRSFQPAFNRATFSSTTGSSLHQLLSPSAAASIHPAKSRLPFSSSSPNLVATGSKHVLVDSDTGQVITTVLPPAGNGQWLDDGKLRKNSSIASGMASVITVKSVILVTFIYHTKKQNSDT